MTSRTLSARTVLLLLTGAVLFPACKGTNTNCDDGASNAWTAIVVNNAPSLPRIFQNCGIKAKKTSLINVTSAMKVRIDLTADSGVSPDSTVYSFWTKNTAYTTNGTARADTLQVSGFWQPDSINFVENSRSYSTFFLPLDVNIGWPITSGVKEKDSIHVAFRTPKNFTDATYGGYNGVWWKWYKVKNGVTTPYVQHPSVIHSGSSTSWNLIPADDTGGYAIDWYWNGSLESSFKDKYTFTKTMPTAGMYPLRVDVFLFDTTYQFNYYVDVPVEVTITGSASVSNSVTNYYSVSATGGTAPYSYQWYIDGSPYSTSTSFAAPYWALYSDHQLEVFATDANSVVGYSELHVFVSSCDPEDPGCQSELRASPTPRKAPATRPPTRRPAVRVLPPAVRRP